MEKSVLESVQQMDFVDEAELLFGKYDFMAKVSANDIVSLKGAISDHLLKVPGLASATVLVACDFNGKEINTV